MTLQVYVRGKRQFKHSRVLGDERDTSFGVEILEIQKNEDEFTIEPKSVVYYEN
jgi:phage host-nuclease inhibitor protein Gam